MRPVPKAPCLGLIHEFEKGPNGSFAATAYQDPAGWWTIGWGHKLSSLISSVWTEEQADEQALTDLNDAANGVCDALPAVVDGLTEGQYAALIDLAFNIGVATFRASTLCHYVNSGNLALAPGQFSLWCHGRVNGREQVLPGLVRRRAAEVAVWKAPTQ